jgi:lactoylglutathione lyase
MSHAASLRLELFVNDIAASVTFYRDILGFAVADEQPGYVAVRLDGIVFGIGARATLPPNHHFSLGAPGASMGTGVEIVVEVDDVDALYTRVIAGTYPVVTPLGRRSWGLTDFRILDPDGYYLRVTSRT